DGDRIVEIVAGPRDGAAEAVHFSFPDHYIVPGFIDVHVHGVEGTDALDGGTAITTMAERLPRYGVTAFCPTSLACDPPSLRRMLAGVRAARTTRPPGVRPGSDRGQTGVRPLGRARISSRRLQPRGRTSALSRWRRRSTAASS